MVGIRLTCFSPYQVENIYTGNNELYSLDNSRMIIKLYLLFKHSHAFHQDIPEEPVRTCAVEPKVDDSRIVPFPKVDENGEEDEDYMEGFQDAKSVN